MKQRSNPYLSFLNRHIPGQLVVQITNGCNASCPQCGMRVPERFKRSSLLPGRPTA